MEGPIRLDLHVHSRCSGDAGLQVETILSVARQRGLGGVAVTDHETVAGGLAAVAANKDASFLVIPGAEYATDLGHILALFLTRELTLNNQEPRPWQNVVAAIHDQGGLAFLAHPLKRPRVLPPNLPGLDGLETFNARAAHAGNSRANQEAAALALSFGLPGIGGSDAHWAGEIGSGFWEAEQPGTRPSLEEVRELLRQGKGRVGGRLTPLYYETCSQLLKASRRKDYKRVPRIAAKFVLCCAGFKVGQRRLKA